MAARVEQRTVLLTIPEVLPWMGVLDRSAHHCSGSPVFHAASDDRCSHWAAQRRTFDQVV